MGSSTGRDYTKHVNESHVESVMERVAKGSDAESKRESCMLCTSVEASDVGRSANLQVEEPGVHLRINLMKSHFHMMKCNTV